MAIAHLEPSVAPVDDPRELQPRRDLIQLLVGHPIAAADAPVGLQHGLAVERLLREHVAHELEIAVGLAALAKEQRTCTRSSTASAVNAGGGDSASDRIVRSVRYG